MADSYTSEHREGVSRPRLAALLDQRWSASAIEKYENGERTPSPEFLHYFARALELDVKAEHALVHLRAADAYIQCWEDYLNAVKQ